MKYLFITLSLFFCTEVFNQTPEQSYFEWTTMPFSQEELEERRVRLMQILANQGHTELVIIPAGDGFTSGETFRQADDFYYLTGLELPNALLTLHPKNQTVILFVPDRDLRFENGGRPNDFPGRPFLADPALSEKTGLEIRGIESFEIFIQRYLATQKTVQINNGRFGPITYPGHEFITTWTPAQVLIHALRHRHPETKFKNIYGSIAVCRMIKSTAEIDLIRKAVNITVSGIEKAAKSIRPGITERALEGILENQFKQLGSQRTAFGSIIKSGPNSLWPWRILATHYNRRNRQLQDGDLVIFDVGAEYNQYVSDVGRTFPVGGQFSEEQERILVMETSIADSIIAAVRPGITFNDIRRLTDRIIPVDQRQYMQVGLYFGHHLGLSTGDPNLPNATLQPGMIFTVEPWYYNHDLNIAVFTEDVLLVTKSGCENLSRRLPRTPEGLIRLMNE